MNDYFFRLDGLWFGVHSVAPLVTPAHDHERACDDDHVRDHVPDHDPDLDRDTDPDHDPDLDHDTDLVPDPDPDLDRCLCFLP